MQKVCGDHTLCKEAPFPAPNQAQNQDAERERGAALGCTWETAGGASGWAE